MMISKNEIKFIRSLKFKKRRIEVKYFLVEGEKNILELIKSTYKIAFIVCTEAFFNQYNPYLKKIECKIVKKSLLSSLSSLKKNEEVLAVVHTPTQPKINFTVNTVALDGINDPGNLGTIIRTMDWFGIKQLVCSLDTVDCFNPKVIQASMGSFCNIDVVYFDIAAFCEQFQGVKLGASLQGEAVSKQHFTHPSLLVLGSESHGIRPHVANHLDQCVTINTRGKGESLNVGVAAGILCYFMTHP